MDVNWGGSCVFRKINFIILGYSTLYTCYFQLQFLSWPSASKVGKVLFFISFLVHVFSTAEKRLPPMTAPCLNDDSTFTKKLGVVYTVSTDVFSRLNFISSKRATNLLKPNGHLHSCVGCNHLHLRAVAIGYTGCDALMRLVFWY